MVSITKSKPKIVAVGMANLHGAVDALFGDAARREKVMTAMSNESFRPREAGLDDWFDNKLVQLNLGDFQSQVEQMMGEFSYAGDEVYDALEEKLTEGTNDGVVALATIAVLCEQEFGRHLSFMIAVKQIYGGGLKAFCHGLVAMGSSSFNELDKRGDFINLHAASAAYYMLLRGPTDFCAQKEEFKGTAGEFIIKQDVSVAFKDEPFNVLEGANVKNVMKTAIKIAGAVRILSGVKGGPIPNYLGSRQMEVMGACQYAFAVIPILNKDPFTEDELKNCYSKVNFRKVNIHFKFTFTFVTGGPSTFEVYPKYIPRFYLGVLEILKVLGVDISTNNQAVKYIAELCKASVLGGVADALNAAKNVKSDKLENKQSSSGPAVVHRSQGLQTSLAAAGAPVQKGNANATIVWERMQGSIDWFLGLRHTHPNLVEPTYRAYQAIQAGTQSLSYFASCSRPTGNANNVGAKANAAWFN